MWNVEYTDKFEAWFDSLDEGEQKAVTAAVRLLRQEGPNLGRPHVDTIKGSRHSNMKELRKQYKGNPYRVFFAFDPRRCAAFLIGGNKGGDDRFYEKMIPEADRIYDEYLHELSKEGLI